MGVDQTGQDGFPSPIHDVSARGCWQVAALDLGDTLAVNEQGDSFLRLVSEAIDQPDIP